MIPIELRIEAEQTLIDEYWLLDNDRLEDWLDLMDDELRYWAPVREDLGRQGENFSRPHLLTHFDEDRSTMGLRVARLRTGLAHAEEPPSRVRHFVSNIKIIDAADSGDVTLVSNFIVFRSRAGREETLFVGVRNDSWKRNGNNWRLRERMIVFDHDLINNITVFV